MKIFKGKAFFFKTILLHLFLVLIISFVSIHFWENPIYDLMINTTLKAKEQSNVSLIMIDDKSTNTYRLPWSRALYGEIFEYLSKYTNAKVIVFDSLIMSNDKQYPKADDDYFFNTIAKIPNYVGGFMALTQEYGNSITGNEYDINFANKFLARISDLRGGENRYSGKYKSLTIFPTQYFKSISNTGSVNFSLDPVDGVARSANDLIYYKNKLYPSLALKSYMLTKNIDSIKVSDKYITADTSELRVPIYIDNGNITHNIKFYKQIYNNSTYSHKCNSAIDIINSKRQIEAGKKPQISPSEFEDKIVIVGANSLSVEDVLETPISIKQPGADVQATIIDNFLNNEYIKLFTTAQNFIIILSISIIAIYVILNLSFIVSLITLLIIAITYIILCVFAFSNNIAPLVITPLAVQLSTMIFGYSYRFILEGKNKEKIKNAMGKYLSQDIMKNVVQNIDDIKLGGKKANVTVLFSDIRGFTSMSEKMTAEEVSMILNEYFSEMEPIITKYNGVINKFIGDAVMAIFGEPIQDINHPQNAVKCAVEMLKKVEQLREKWLFEGKPKIEIGIGINTGEAFVGNIGSEKRLEYTVIGDTVNLASRIEGYNKVYKTNLLISSSTYSQVSDIVDVIKIADVTIRGKSKKMDIYEVMRLSN